MKKLFIYLLISLLSSCLYAKINPNKVYILANTEIKESLLLADKYCELRNISKENIISFSMPKSEEISYSSYKDIEKKLIKALNHRQAMHSVEKDGQSLNLSHDIDFLVSCYGVPLKIKGNNGKGGMSTNASAFDSAVSAIFLGYENKRIANPSFRNKDPNSQRNAKIIRVARLSGKDYNDSLNIIKNAIYVEENGLIGRAYVDDSTQVTKKAGYLKFSEDILARMGYDTSTSPNSALMSFKERFDAPALYFAWYTGNPCYYFTLSDFEMPKGAIAMHLHSFSMTTKNKGWATSLINKRASATVGNVYEPYLGFVHNFNLYIEALHLNFTAGEASYYASPALHWQNIFVGDPLYMPFKHSLKAQLEDIDAGKITENSQYVIIRAMNLLEKKGETEKALELAFKVQNKMENTALNWKISQIYEKIGNKNLAILYAKMTVDKLSLPSNLYYGLNYEVAKYLSDNDLNTEALSLVKEHIKAREKNAYYIKDTLPLAIKYAKLAKDEAIYAEFSQKLKENP